MRGKVRKRNEPASNPQWRTGNRKVIEGCRRSIKQNGGGKIMRIQSILLATAGLASLTCAQAARATRPEEHTSELPSLTRKSYALLRLKQKLTDTIDDSINYKNKPF